MSSSEVEVGSLEAKLRRNKESIGLAASVLAFIAFFWGVYTWQHGVNEKAQDEIRAEAASKLKASLDEAERQYTQRLDESTADFRMRIEALETSANVINTLQILSHYSDDANLRGTTASEVKDGKTAITELNLPRYRALAALTDVLMEPDPKKPKKAKDQFLEVGQHICRILFAKCQSADQTVAATALIAVGHVLNENKLATFGESDPDFKEDLNSAFLNGKFDHVEFQGVTPNLRSFALQNTTFTASQFIASVGAIFDNANLSGTDFQRCRFMNASFQRSTADESAANFQGAVFESCTKFAGASLPKANFTAATFIDSGFVGNDELGRVKMSRAKFIDLQEKSKHLEFQRCRLPFSVFSCKAPLELKFTDCVLDHADFVGANLKAPSIVDGSACRTKFGASIIGEGVFSNVDLTASDFGRCALAESAFNSQVTLDWAILPVDCPLVATLEASSGTDKVKLAKEACILLVDPLPDANVSAEAVAYRFAGYVLFVESGGQMFAVTKRTDAAVANVLSLLQAQSKVKEVRVRLGLGDLTDSSTVEEVKAAALKSWHLTFDPPLAP